MAEATPMLEQYKRVKEEYPQALVFFRLGDFYELFSDDALIASRELEIVLTGRDVGKDVRVPMCGVPCHAATQYIGKLLARGYRVALCEQLEDPRRAKGLVARDVVRVYTPGTIVEDGLLPSKTNNYLAAVAKDRQAYGLAAVDLSTGEFLLTDVTGFTPVADELVRLAPAEVLARGLPPLPPEAARNVNDDPANFHDLDESAALLAGQYGLATVDALGLAGKPAALLAAAAVVSYLQKTQRGEVRHLQWPRLYRLDEFMYLDTNSRRNLELTRTLRDGRAEGTLLWVLDRTATPMGARTLRAWLEAPLARRAAIERRLDAVEELTRDLSRRQEIAALLARAADLPRLVSRLACTGGNGRDLFALGQTLKLLPELAACCRGLAGEALSSIASALEPPPCLGDKLCAAVSPDAPLTVREGGIFKPGHDARLDELRAAAQEGRRWLAELEAKERERTGIRSLKVGFNQVFGYFFEITRANLGLVPPDYVRRQTLANAERFINEELAACERRILGADERAKALEYELFLALRAEVVAETSRLQEIGAALGSLDALAALADAAVRYGYVRPVITEDGALVIEGGRHPVVERCLPGGGFVPNDTSLAHEGARIQIITGPNMSGKSTYLRQTALITLMAHAGSFVPARKASIGLVDRIFTRLGAADDLAGGRSTFLVEMTETAEILRAATDRSLLILDEIGRGTGTMDGQAIARAVLEYIHDRVGAKALFATHYHEVTALAEDRPGMANFNVAVVRRGDEITFCHRLEPGAADRSYGIEVARLAGLPPGVLARARVLQLELEAARSQPAEARAETAAGRQMTLFGGLEEEIARELSALDLDGITPVEALNWLFGAQRRLRGGAGDSGKRHGRR
ncbi:MAG: DNA mismatch repair protein MutS [Patescibacteria group bacterium]